MPRLRRIMTRLRDRITGCPWDVEQTFQSIAPYTIEEAYEVADAIERRDMRALRDELGDLLLQVVYHAEMAREVGAFDFDDVAEGICEKLVRRHPHVFGDAVVDSAAAQTAAWERHKRREREAEAGAPGAPGSGADGSALAGIPSALPALKRAEKLQKRAALVGFDWPAIGPVLAKLVEEIGELRTELEGERNQDRLADELGDLLFASVNLARHMGLDAEAALRRANGKFERRFRRIEALLAESGGRLPEDADAAELDRLWEQAKQEEKQSEQCFSTTPSDAK
jgi:MazG family protein